MKKSFCALLLALPAFSYADMGIKCDNGIEFKAKYIAISRATDTEFLKNTMAVAVLLQDDSVHTFADLIPPNVKCVISSENIAEKK